MNKNQGRLYYEIVQKNCKILQESQTFLGIVTTQRISIFEHSYLFDIDSIPKIFVHKIFFVMFS